ncbi:fungal-specific transcription factor domain-containing protein [Lophiotrema nucula]|uniref:Fungal-specific transcription factor domain-containing protein n=1 Tax=Lophiotrema nucula TaxID=690887 RepID=A0A6A5YRS6_9PLEO|nr:fungal-specific transcription factor domain-containing protein [Lophiotrema nucula]
MHRCRRRKQKCDLKQPNCSNCESAHVRCLTYHSGKQAEIPRNYVSDLEAQIESLTRENQELRGQTQPASFNGEASTSLETSFPAIRDLSSTPTEGIEPAGENLSHLQNLVTSVRSVVVEPSKQPRFLGPSSGTTLARMVMASIRTDALPASPLFSQQRSRDHFSSASATASASASASAIAAESSLPPRHAADHLVDVYFQYRTPHLPVVERSRVDKALESAYSFPNNHQPSNQPVERDMFTTYMIFAIALCNVPNPSGGTGRVMQSEGCFRSAIGWVEKVITYSKSDLETLQAVLLLAQFVSMCPWQGSLWHLTGIALRLCVDMGLHWETEGQSLNTDPNLLYERRRLWYSAYYLDRVLGITLGRPFGITDESIRVALPNPWAATGRSLGRETNDFDIHHQQAHNHLFSMAKLESEIKHVQNSRTWPLKIAYPKPNFASWVQDIQPRLREWRGTIPNPSKAHPSSIFANQAYWDAIYNNSILLLYRPNTSIQQQPTEALTISHEAACNLIANIKLLQREGRLDVLWKSVHSLFMAGLTVIYGLWQSKEMRDRNPVSNSISALQSCASTLSAMSETFQGAAGCRDVFDTLSSVTIEWLVTNDEETRQRRIEFEQQVEELLQQLQPSREGMSTDETSARDMSNILSTDNFAFGEMLSSAAQWPEMLDINFAYLGYDRPMADLGLQFEPF